MDRELIISDFIELLEAQENDAERAKLLREVPFCWHCGAPVPRLFGQVCGCREKAAATVAEVVSRLRVERGTVEHGMDVAPVANCFCRMCDAARAAKM